MRVFIIISLSLLVTIVLACASQSSNKASDQYLYFGSGGGFSGMSKDFRLSANGTLQQKPNITEPWGDIGTIKQATTAQLFIQIDQLELRTLNHDYPGNRYHYIKVAGWSSQNESQPIKNKITWGSADHEPSKEIQKLHGILMKLTSRKN